MKYGLLILLALCLPARAGDIYTHIPNSPDPAKTYLIYLHGRIIENAGPRPTDPRFGRYDYPAVLEALSSRGAVVISAQRPPKTDMNHYAGIVVAQVEELIEQGVAPENIVVVGFSKGGGIATRASSFLRRPQVRFVLLAACPEGPPKDNLRLTGQVLSLYETSDTLAGTCKPLAEQPEAPLSFKEISISTGKLHGAFYQPLPAWVDPVLDWVHGDGDTPDEQSQK
ncbi:alpha/beta hydrolase [Bowmanella dokdonensis]|uniref:Alpha/beta hydrolase n=1 Tax=Bowmanella dokdonensis TaxID=751969 RepID=A0A939DMD5_9ALTE|nr:alpha/beta hydrolase [Bowmanella dokdonensis]MBN7825143.1 alpha/beta hydrolase [Bowmanella dokdonensis]